MFEFLNYWVTVALMMIGFYGVIAHHHLLKKMMALSIFQVSVLLFYITIGGVKEALPPILKEGVTNYVNPLPHVLMLTAIVVGISVFAVGMAIIVRIKKAYGTVEEDEIFELDQKQNQEERVDDAK